MKCLPLFFCILTLLSPIAMAREFPIPEAGITISLPEPWRAVDPAVVKDYNSDMLSKRPQSTARYITGFTRGPVPAGHVVGSDYIWIQRTPGAITPDQLLQLIPKTLEREKKTFDDLLKNEIKASEAGSPYFDHKAGVVVMPSSTTRADGEEILGIAFLLPLRAALISIAVQSSPDDANAVFTDAYTAVSSLHVQEDAKPVKSWQERLQELLGK